MSLAFLVKCVYTISLLLYSSSTICHGFSFLLVYYKFIIICLLLCFFFYSTYHTRGQLFPKHTLAQNVSTTRKTLHVVAWTASLIVVDEIVQIRFLGVFADVNLVNL